MNDEAKIIDSLKIKISPRVSPDFQESLMRKIQDTPRMAPSLPQSRPRLSIAAAISAFVIVSAAAAIIGLTYKPSPDKAPSGPSITATTEAPPQQTIKFRKASLETVINAVCDKYDATANYENESVKDIELHITIDADASLAEAIEVINQFNDITLDLRPDSTIIIR